MLCRAASSPPCLLAGKASDEVFGQSRSSGSKTHLHLVPVEDDAAVSQAINKVLTPEVLRCGGPEQRVLQGLMASLPACASVSVHPCKGLVLNMCRI